MVEWRVIAAEVASSLPPHRSVCIPRWAVPSPESSCLSPTRLGLGRGRHYYLPLPGGGRLHVIDRGGWCYLAHWDIADPRSDPLGHLVYDAPLFAAAMAGLVNALSSIPVLAPLQAVAGALASGLAGLLVALAWRLG